MTNVTLIGTGNMGKALSEVVTKGGHSVQALDTDDIDQDATGDIVMLAVPYEAVDDVLEQRGASFTGKVVVDLTNPVDMETFDSLVVPPDSSAAAHIAAKAPQARVVKAFNTTFAAALAEGQVGPLTTTVLIAGDDAEAKQELARVVHDGGLEAIDAGPLSRARELEALGFLQMTLAARDKIGWTGGFGVIK